MKLNEIQIAATSLSYSDLEKLESFVKKTRMAKWQEEREERNRKYLKGVEQRERAKKKYAEIAWDFRKWLKDTLKPGDIIKCKGYSKLKKVVEVRGDYVFCMCGWFWKGQFESNGYGSENGLDYVTHIFKDGEFQKSMDLFKQNSQK